MEEKLSACYERLQKLSVPPTRGNMEILLQTLYDIREVYDQIREEKANGGHDGPAADSERRDDH